MNEHDIKRFTISQISCLTLNRDQEAITHTEIDKLTKASPRKSKS